MTAIAAWSKKSALAWRIAQAALFVVALLGPWVFDQVHVPAEYPCSPPFVRLEGDFCGISLSGLAIIAFVGSGIGEAVTELAAGTITLADLFPEMVWGVVLLALGVPLFVPLGAIGRFDSRRLGVALLPVRLLP